MDKDINFFDFDDISVPIKDLLDEFREKCVNALLEDVTTNIGMLQDKNDELTSTNNALREKISEYEKQSELNKIHLQQNELGFILINILKENIKQSEDKREFLLNFCNTLFKKDYKVGDSDLKNAPLWIVLCTMYYSNMDTIIKLLDLCEINYPDNIYSFILPVEWDETNLDYFMATMKNHCVCNGEYYNNNLQYWTSYNKPLMTPKQQCDIVYSEIPWQFILRNPLLKKEKYLKQIGQNLCSNKSNWHCFVKLTNYQKLTTDEFLLIIDNIPIDNIKDKLTLVQFCKNYVNVLDPNKYKQLLDIFYSELSDYDKKYTNLLINPHTTIYLKNWFREINALDALQYLSKYSSELQNTYDSATLKELYNFVTNKLEMEIQQ